MTGTMALAIAVLACAANGGEVPAAPPVGESMLVVSTASPEPVACQHCGQHVLPNVSGSEHIAARLAFWHMRCHSSCDMYPRSEYPAAAHGNYYFRAYNWTKVAWLQQEAASWGGDPRNPVSNQIFEGIYRDLGVAAKPPAEEVPVPPAVFPNDVPDAVPSPSDDPAAMEQSTVPSPIEMLPPEQRTPQVPPLPAPPEQSDMAKLPGAAVEGDFGEPKALTSSRRVVRPASYRPNPLRHQAPVVEPSR